MHAIRVKPAEVARRPVLVDMALCARRVVTLLLRRQLHRRRDRLGSWVRLPDGRHFAIFRDTSSGGADARPRGDGPPGEVVTIAVWFHLRWVPPGSRVRRYLFERESILNTFLFAGFSGYRVKLWMVDPKTADYAGLYLWQGRKDAERYARYITAVLRPLSVPGSVGSAILDADAFAGSLAV